MPHRRSGLKTMADLQPDPTKTLLRAIAILIMLAIAITGLVYSLRMILYEK